MRNCSGNRRGMVSMARSSQSWLVILCPTAVQTPACMASPRAQPYILHVCKHGTPSKRIIALECTTPVTNNHTTLTRTSGTRCRRLVLIHTDSDSLFTGYKHNCEIRFLYSLSNDSESISIRMIVFIKIPGFVFERKVLFMKFWYS